MTDEEAVTAFHKELEGSCDYEEEHGSGDGFVSKILKEHGFPKLAEAYDEKCQHWWYS